MRVCLNPFLFQVSYFIIDCILHLLCKKACLNPFLFQVSYFFAYIGYACLLRKTRGLNPFLFQVSYFNGKLTRLNQLAQVSLNPFLFQVSYFLRNTAASKSVKAQARVLNPFCFRSLISGRYAVSG